MDFRGAAPMDPNTLVELQIRDVPNLVDQLTREKMEVKAAFWYYRSEADQWFLYLVSDIVDQNGLRAAYTILGRAISQLPNLLIDRFAVKVVSPSDPIAKAVLDFRSKRHAQMPTWVHSANLGDVYIEHAYIYG